MTPIHLRADNTPPRNGVIFLYAVATIVALFGLEIMFRAYFLAETDQAKEHALVKSADLAKLRAHEEKMLSAKEVSTGGIRLPTGSALERAKEQLGQMPRESMPMIAPNPSKDMDPIKGWMLAPASPERMNITEFAKPVEGVDASTPLPFDGP